MMPLVYWLHHRLNADADDWQYPRNWTWLMTSAPVLMVLAVAILTVFAYTSPSLALPLFEWLTAEDSLIEWLQFGCITVVAVSAWRIGVRVMRTENRYIGYLYFAIAFTSVFIAGEEISWGQRLVGWSTPEQFAAINKQGETSIHNIGVVQHLFLLLIFLASMYGAFVPLAQAVFGDEYVRTPQSMLFVPPLAVVPAFLIMFSYRLVRMTLYERSEFLVVKFGESVELSFYFGLALFMWLNLRRLRQSRLIPAALPSSVITSAGEVSREV